MLLIGLILLMVWYSAVFLPRDHAEKGLSASEEKHIQIFPFSFINES